jgi:hypothetical protein
MTNLMDDEDSDILTKEEQRLFGESLRRVLISDCPNPTRKGCPAPKIIGDLAFHKPLGNPALFEDHQSRCGMLPCVWKVLMYREECKKQRRNRVLIGAALALVGVLTAVVASAGSAGPKEVEC